MEREDTWRTANYLLQCCWYLDYITRPGQTGEVVVSRKRSKAITCLLFKNLSGLRSLTTCFSENSAHHVSQVRSHTYSIYEWTTLLQGEGEIHWYDQGWCNFQLCPPQFGESDDKIIPKYATWTDVDFSSSTYELLKIIVKPGESGCVSASVNDTKVLLIELQKSHLQRSNCFCCRVLCLIKYLPGNGLDIHIQNPLETCTLKLKLLNSRPLYIYVNMNVFFRGMRVRNKRLYKISTNGTELT